MPLQSSLFILSRFSQRAETAGRPAGEIFHQPVELHFYLSSLAFAPSYLHLYRKTALLKYLSGRFVWPAELTTTGREGRWAPFQLDQSVTTRIVRFHPKPVSCKTVFLQLLIQNPLLFRWTEGKAFSPPLTLLSCQSAKGARLCHCFLFIVISSMPKLIVCQCCSQNWFQVLVRHSFRSSRLAELSVVKGEVRKTFSMLTLPLQSAQSAQCVWT